MLSNLTVDDEGLAFAAGPEDEHRVVDLLLDGRRIWSFRIDEATPVGDERSQRRVAWPDPMRPYLDGVGTFTLRPLDAAADAPSTTGRLGAGEGPVQLVDSHGIGLVVNSKFGRLAHALGDYDDGMIQRLLDHVDEVRAVLATHTTDVYVMSGTLLGPYRDGRLMRHDDDADLGYLSAHSHPADVAREAFVIGRKLRAAGFEVVRNSGGHVQIHFAHEGRPDSYVDVFTGWITDDGWWHQGFAIRARLLREQLVPPTSIEVEGRPEPAPRDPEAALEANYGPGWKVPDPSYRFELPRSTTDRVWGWLGDQDMDRNPWEDHYRYDVAGDRVAPGSTHSGFAADVQARLDPGCPVVELGTGRGHDALWLAEQGHPVTALDYVRWPIARAAAEAERRGTPARFRTLNLYDPRAVLAFGAEIAARPGPRAVYAHGLLGTLWDVGRPILFRLLSMLLRSGGQAHLDVPGRSLAPVPGEGPPLHRAVDLAELRAEMARFGLHIDETREAADALEHMPWTAEDAVPTTRMVVSWRRARA